MIVLMYKLIKLSKYSLILSLPRNFGRIPKDQQQGSEYVENLYLLLKEKENPNSDIVILVNKPKNVDTMELKLNMIGKKQPGIILPNSIREKSQNNYCSGKPIFLSFNEESKFIIIHQDWDIIKLVKLKRRNLSISDKELCSEFCNHERFDKKVFNFVQTTVKKVILRQNYPEIDQSIKA